MNFRLTVQIRIDWFKGLKKQSHVRYWILFKVYKIMCTVEMTKFKRLYLQNLKYTLKISTDLSFLILEAQSLQFDESISIKKEHY
jgi:hypothetical protein